MLKRLLNKQSGYVISVELAFMLTVLICVLVICAGAFGPKVIAEWADIGGAIGAWNQSYTLTGVAVGHPNDPNHPTDIATWSGSGYSDHPDFCDQTECTCGVRVCQAPSPEGI